MNEWIQDAKEALEQLGTQKLRTFLTLLGMIFGVGAVIAMLSIGEGAEREALQLIDAMGMRNVIVKTKAVPRDRLAEVREDSLGLSLKDVAIARETLPFLVGATALKRVRTYEIFCETGKSDATVAGVTADIFAFGQLEMAAGRPLLDLDGQRGARVCVLGSQAAFDLFGNRPPLDRQVKINHLWFRVVGVLADRNLSRSEFQGVRIDSPRNRIFIPIDTALNRFPFNFLEEELDECRFQIAAGMDTGKAAAGLNRLLESRHRGVDDFELVVPEALLEQHRRTQDIFNIVMSAIAGISLLVGGIGIMNIMLANVLERTREIGLRRAIGARRRDIQRLFLIEAFAISTLGGLIGIAIGFAIAKGISLYSGWAVAWSGAAVLPAILVCATVGLVFGIYPAVKAAKLDPIEALRHD
ncbi:ABC transporter permease [Sulfidibacter corallicola]|uniref:ABC transporter permease n=1 Tax=Sulfidibacter corallicola TaxID=2818388 RepID=A0A8A4TP26_SULCO|nr:ABC transporter permease [Sulfidibacter corallicola]QTD51303.1 ABC transporter permease [Sulfidibacter corallicola]